MPRTLAIAATALLVACPSRPEAPRAADDRALRVQVAQAEARRGDGVAELGEIALHGDATARVLALRGLGRIGGPQAIALLSRAVADPDPAIVAAAASALGIAAALDEPAVPKPGEQASQVAAALVAAVGHGDSRVVAAAIGRGGDVVAQAALVTMLADPKTAAAAALALGRYGRRKLGLSLDAGTALITATRSSDPRVRFAATYALARRSDFEKCSDSGCTGAQASPADAALAARIADDDPETRANAIAGLARRGAVAVGRTAIEQSLRDREWRVAVEAVRALAGEHGDDAGRDAVAAALARHTSELVHGTATEAHVVIEGLRALAPYGGRPIVAAALAALAALPPDPHVAPLARGWITCLATAAIVRAAPQPDVARIAGCGDSSLPDHLRLALLGDLVTAGVGDAATRRGALRILLSHGDARLRAAGITALAATWHDGDDGDRAALVATFASALGSPDPIIAGSAADAASALYDAMARDQLARTLDAAVIARATSEREPELSASLYELIGKRAIAAGADACRAGLGAAAVRARAAAECLGALGEAVPVPEMGPAQPPPLDVAAVIGKHLRWHVVTSRGEIVIELRPDLAPWNVAAIVALTAKHFYDGLEFHRVVPDFVVQGGDPTMSGWGGPGFVTPAEPSDDGFAAGGVGMADAGRDSGGSQWFVMHSAAPHLDGRYTCVGAVVSGQKSADALLIGDRVEHATIEVIQ